MKARQKFAIEHPAWSGSPLDRGCGQPGKPFGSTLAVTHLPIEDPEKGKCVAVVWHVGVSHFDPAGLLVPMTFWKPKTEKRARALALELLSGVGAPESDLWRPSEMALHFFRLLDESEVKKLDPVWIADIRALPDRVPKLFDSR